MLFLIQHFRKTNVCIYLILLYHRRENERTPTIIYVHLDGSAMRFGTLFHIRIIIMLPLLLDVFVPQLTITNKLLLPVMFVPQLAITDKLLLPDAFILQLTITNKFLLLDAFAPQLAIAARYMCLGVTKVRYTYEHLLCYDLYTKTKFHIMNSWPKITFLQPNRIITGNNAKRPVTVGPGTTTITPNHHIISHGNKIVHSWATRIVNRYTCTVHSIARAHSSHPAIPAHNLALWDASSDAPHWPPNRWLCIVLSKLQMACCMPFTVTKKYHVMLLETCRIIWFWRNGIVPIHAITMTVENNCDKPCFVISFIWVSKT